MRGRSKQSWREIEHAAQRARHRRNSKQMRTRMSRLAEMDLAEITDFIARDNPARALEFEEELIEQVRKIGRAPFAYVERPDLRAQLRSCVHGAWERHDTSSARAPPSPRAIIVAWASVPRRKQQCAQRLCPRRDKRLSDPCPR